MDSGAARAICASVLPRVSPENRAPGMLVPMRSAQAGESGDNINAVGALHRKGQLFDFVGGINDLQAIAQPLDHCSGNKHAALQGVLRFSIHFPGHGSE